jgi:hypothetical protein
MASSSFQLFSPLLEGRCKVTWRSAGANVEVVRSVSLVFVQTGDTIYCAEFDRARMRSEAQVQQAKSRNSNKQKTV